MTVEEEAELARAIALATGSNGRPPSRHTLTNPNPHQLAELEQQWKEFADSSNETAHALIAEHGTLEQAANKLGASLAARGEAYAGVAADDVRTGMTARYNLARAKFDEHMAHLDEIRGSAEEELRNHTKDLREARDAAEKEWVAAETPEERIRARDAYVQAGTVLTAAKEELANTPGSINHEYMQVMHKANQARTVLVEGVDAQAKKELRALSDGYQQALRDVRRMGGGTFSWHERTQKKAREAFDETAQVFPDDWVEYSENDPSGKPVAKVQKSRAHYSHGHVEHVRKRMPVIYRRETYGQEEEAELRNQFEWAPNIELRRSGTDGYNTTQWELAEYETYITDPDDPGSPPRGRGWDLHKYSSPSGAPRAAWRRPRTRMELVSQESVPEIKTNEREPTVEGRSATFATATHELSHRFEATVPDISTLEQEFLERRTTDPVTGQRTRRVEIYKRSREYAYEGGFTNLYMGKTYTNRDGSENRTHYELLSTGAEALFAGRHGGLIGVGGDGQHKADHDMRAFILGVFASAGRKDAAPGRFSTTKSDRQDEYDLASSSR